MNIVIFAQGLHLGGRERFAAWIASQLAQRGHQVTLGVRSPVESDHQVVDPGVTVVRLLDRVSHSSPAGQGNFGWLTRLPRSLRQPYRATAFGLAARSLVKAKAPDVVIGIGSQVSMTILGFGLGRTQPVVVRESENPFAYQTPPTIERTRIALYKQAAAVVVLTTDIAEQARRDWGLDEVVMIPNARMFNPTEVAGMQQRSRVVLFMGRLSEIKGLPTLLRAWHEANARHRGWRLRIVGDGPERARLESLVAQLGVGESVGLPGTTTAVEQEYRNARVFVLPSKSEGFPLALLEAMSFGCACLATASPGGTPELLGHGAAGLLVPVDDPSTMATALDRLTKDDRLAVELSEAGRRRAAEFDQGAIVQQWEELLRQAVVRGGDRPLEALLAIATSTSSGDDTAAFWRLWREARPDLNLVNDPEVALLPAAWTRAREAGVDDCDAGRLDGLRRQAALSTAVLLRQLVAAQSALRTAGIDSAAGGGAEVVLLGALPASQRRLNRVDLWVSRHDFAAAQYLLATSRLGWHNVMTGSVCATAIPGLALRSRLPSLPPLDGGYLVAGRTTVDWAGMQVDVVRPTQAAFVADLFRSARRIRRVGTVDRPHTPLGDVESVLRELDYHALARLPQFDPELLGRLRRSGGWFF